MSYLTRRQLNLALATASLSGILPTNIALSAPPPDPVRAELDALLGDIAKTEKSITNITVKSTAIEQHLVGDQWIDQPITVELLARMDGTPGGKARFDVSNQVLQWRDGEAPYSQCSYS